MMKQSAEVIQSSEQSLDMPASQVVVKCLNLRVTLRRFLSELGDFLVVPDYTFTGISNFPDSVLKKVELKRSGNSA